MHFSPNHITTFELVCMMYVPLESKPIFFFLSNKGCFKSLAVIICGVYLQCEDTKNTRGDINDE
jgi:hypothetical protein